MLQSLLLAILLAIRLVMSRIPALWLPNVFGEDDERLHNARR